MNELFCLFAFRELKLSSSEIVIVLNKFASSFETLSPDTLPALAYQLFAMSQTALHIMIPILALDKYFYRFYYKKLFAEMDSNTTDIDSIGINYNSSLAKILTNLVQISNIFRCLF